MIAPDHFLLVLSYFAVWWTGCMAAASYRGASSLRGMRSALVSLVALCAVSLLVLMLQYRLFSAAGTYPFLPFRHFFFALLATFTAYSLWRPIVKRVIVRWHREFSFVASISYGIYVLHYPLVVQWSISSTLTGLGVSTIILMGLAYLSDRTINACLKKGASKATARQMSRADYQGR